MPKLFAIAIPIIPGKEEAWKKWQGELRTTRFNDFKDSRSRLNVHERTFLQHTPMGDMVIVTLEGEDPQSAFAGFASADDEFTRWFVQGVKEVHGIDLTQPPQGALPEIIADSKENVS